MLLVHRLTVLTVAVLVAHCRNGDGGPTSASASGVAAGWAPSRVAEIYFTTEVAGYVEPCGCTTKPLGGLPRLASVVRSGRHDRILVDAGNLLFPPKGIDDVTRAQHLLKADLLARAYRRLGASALNVAAADLSEGAGFLKLLQREGATPFVSANVRPVGDHGPEVARSYLRTVGRVKIGFTGATLPESLTGIDQMTALEYAPVVGAEVRSLQERGADVVVVLAHMSEPLAQELARTVKGIDLILRAPGTSIESKPVAPSRVGQTVIAEAGSQGQYVGRVTLALGPDRPKALLFDEGDRRHRRKQSMLERKIRAFQTQLEAWQDDPAKAAVVATKQKIITRLKAQLAAPPPPVVPPSSPYVRVEQIALTDEIKSDPSLNAALKSYYGQLQAMNAEKGDPAKCAPKPELATYVGTAKCAGCHPDAFAFWKKTKHAAAWKTLTKDNKQYDLTCVGCHVVGYQKPGGFCRVKDVSGFEDVGCENCHGPGSIHAESGDASAIVLKSTEATCADQCHVPEHSDAFNYSTYLRQVTGPGHELQEN
ncbi:MAG: UshA-like (seleno)protein [Myxococcota bacterium]